MVALFSLAASSLAQFAVKDGDRVAFYGDSITDNGEYTNLVETYVVSRFPKWNVRFFNAGVGGDKVSGGILGPIDQRLKRDLLSRKPTVVTIMLGMNDAGYREFVPDLQETYDKGYRHILDVIKQERTPPRVWLLKPSPYDDVTRPPTIAGGYNSVLLRYGQTVEEMAKEYGHWLVDMNFPLADELYRAYSSDTVNASKIIPDRVHPSYGGHLAMAAALLKGWKAEPEAFSVTLDAAGASPEAKGASVADLTNSNGTWTWSQTDDYLPFPVNWKDPVTSLVASTCPSVQEMFLGRTLRFNRLTPGKYQLKIDDIPVATVASTDLANGIDLAKLDTPMSRQAAELHVLTTKRSYLMWVLWRQVEYGLAPLPSKERDEAIVSMRKLEENLIRRQHELALPRPHRFSLSPVSTQ